MVDCYGKKPLDESVRNECCAGCHRPVDTCHCMSASSDDLPTYEGRHVAGRWVPVERLPSSGERRPMAGVSR